ncbi:CG9147 [Drosophila busckii]|uniref:CG9147 n=1 Tax=Drosophila busckii TaxID=30019 RepID=A0A0M4EE23_DROBS|nr:uncharacterized protein LOC108597436 [Drosophila busckii]ALC38255.1 CG9147 [Drosophila busckii]
MPAIWRLHCKKSMHTKLWRHFSTKSKPNAVVIAAAVRTPTKLPGGAAKGEKQLAALIIDELVKRTSMPRDIFKQLIMCSSSDVVSDDTITHMLKNLGLKSCEAHALQDKQCSLNGLQMSLERLRQNQEQEQCIILADTRANLKQSDDQILHSELMTTTGYFGGKAAQEAGNIVHAGAAALALTTTKLAERLDLQPLALVREYLVEHNDKQAIYRLSGMDPIKLTDVHSWQLAMEQQRQQRLGTLANLKSNDVSIYDVNNITASHLLTHTVHALPNGNKACVVMEQEGRCLLLVLEKLIPQSAKGLPQLTLYTKEPCSLCDDLTAELEEKFHGEFELQKVYIDQKENVRFLRLFRFDIPVLFLNGQFLCMHRLNEQLLRERLAALKNNKTA